MFLEYVRDKDRIVGTVRIRMLDLMICRKGRKGGQRKQTYRLQRPSSTGQVLPAADHPPTLSGRGILASVLHNFLGG